jgi:hypothetical protein
MLLHPAFSCSRFVDRKQSKISRAQTGTAGEGRHEENKTLQNLPKVHLPSPLAVDDVSPS